MFFFALLVAVLAPIAEEIFFRGMIFRALKNGMGLWPAAIVSGLLFGAMHIDAATQRAPAAGRPAGACSASRSRCSTRGPARSIRRSPCTRPTTRSRWRRSRDEHNSDFGMVLAGVLWLLMMLFCGFGHLLTDRGGQTSGPGGISGTGSGPVEYAVPR